MTKYVVLSTPFKNICAYLYGVGVYICELGMCVYVLCT